MKISNIIPSIKKKVSIYNSQKAEKNIEKYCKIHDMTTYGDSYKQMYNARGVISNYAKSKGVYVDIYDSRKLVDGDDYVSANIEDKFLNKLKVMVSDLLTGKFKEKIVDANPDIVYEKSSVSTSLFPASGEDNMQVVRHTVSTTEDSFLRNLYRNIEDLTKDVIGNK